MEQTTIAYCAGFFDGEGSVLTGNYRGRYALRLRAGQNNPGPLLRMKEAFRGHLWGPYKNGPHQTDHWRWQVEFKLAREALQAMLPYLTTKRDIAQAALDAGDNQEALVAFRERWQPKRKRTGSE